MMGEISPKIAEAVASARCKKILLPVNQNHVEIIGLANSPMAMLIKDATERITQLCEEQSI
jgi:hypothetical protein